MGLDFQPYKHKNNEIADKPLGLALKKKKVDFKEKNRRQNKKPLGRKVEGNVRNNRKAPI